MIKVLIGDLFKSNAQTIVNTVNCMGVMGKGIAAEFKKRFPKMFLDYTNRCKHGQVIIGEPYLYKETNRNFIINFPTKKHWKSPSHLEDIIMGLDFLVDHISIWNIKSLALPPLGCGNGGLEWGDVGPIIYQKLSHLNIPIELYAPYGTPDSKLSSDFLNKSSNTGNIKGTFQKKINPNWIPLLEVISKLQNQPYANPVGRTIFQKIAFLLTEQKIETGFSFEQGNYGPFSHHLQETINVFSNINLIQERSLGRMREIRISPEYSKFRTKYLDVLNANKDKIDKTVDLFSRIKSTNQAEEVTTVLFAARKLKKSKVEDQVSEQQLYDYIFEWKRTWNNEEKRKAIGKAIRNLEMLHWLKLQFSESLLNDEEMYNLSC